MVTAEQVAQVARSLERLKLPTKVMLGIVSVALLVGCGGKDQNTAVPEQNPPPNTPSSSNLVETVCVNPGFAEIAAQYGIDGAIDIYDANGRWTLFTGAPHKYFLHEASSGDDVMNGWYVIIDVVTRNDGTQYLKVSKATAQNAPVYRNPADIFRAQNPKKMFDRAIDYVDYSKRVFEAQVRSIKPGLIPGETGDVGECVEFYRTNTSGISTTP